ncbi:MAG TPA: PaeR7I family type II restriction endonuclease [Baekduia sp.]|nr:PaeR7I family type II restriction endonuclease [Baekduia sp.]
MGQTYADLSLAIAAYWASKDNQLATAEALQSTAEGSAKAVRGGRHFAPIVKLLASFFTDADYPVSSIHARGHATVLPAYLRPTKNWDLVVVHRNVLVAAFELKALGGPSFGNNYNNRVEEAVGSSTDLAHANAEGLVGPEQPWLGYFFIMEDHPRSRHIVRESSSRSFPIEPIWAERSYQSRYSITGRRLLDTKMYDAVCYLVSSRDDPAPTEPESSLDWQHFSAAIRARIHYMSSLGYP